MDYQAERLGLIVDLAEQSMDIVQRFSNDPIGAENIQTASGPIKNLKQVSADIKSDGQSAIDVAVTELIDTLKTETSVNALIGGLTDTAAVAAENAARAVVAADSATATGKIYASTALGLADTAVDRYFSVPSPNDSEYLILYQNNAGIAVEKKRYPSVMRVNELGEDVQRISGSSPGTTPQAFESLDPDIPASIIVDPIGQILAEFPDPRIAGLEQTSLKSSVFETLDEVSEGEVWILDSDGKILSRLASSSLVTVVAALSSITTQLQGAALKSEFYETLDPAADIMFVDGAGKIIGSVASLAPLQAELTMAAGSHQSLAARLDKGLTPYGDVLGPYANRWSVRDARIRLERLLAGESVQWVLALLGDSYSNDRSYYSQTLAKRLQGVYGMAGAGWVGFGWYSSPISGTWAVGSQPVGISGGVRTDLVPICQVIGTWTCAYNSPASNMPALYKVTSSVPDDYVRFSIPAVGGAYSNSCQLFYSGDGTGVIAVSWDDGATYGANIALSTVGADNVALSGVPSGGCTARIKVVSGAVGLGGVDLKNTAPGVRVHKLGSSGARSVQWVGVGVPWRTQMLALGSHCHQVLLATNDQTDSNSPGTVAANCGTIFTNLAAVLPYADKVMVMPAENQRTTTTVKMPQYAKAGREFAVPRDIGFVDLQYVFGSPDNYAYDYAAANPARPWYASDLIHPDGPTGGRAIAGTLFHFYTQL